MDFRVIEELSPDDILNLLIEMEENTPLSWTWSRDCICGTSGGCYMMHQACRYYSHSPDGFGNAGTEYCSTYYSRQAFGAQFTLMEVSNTYAETNYYWQCTQYAAACYYKTAKNRNMINYGGGSCR